MHTLGQGGEHGISLDLMDVATWFAAIQFFHGKEDSKEKGGCYFFFFLNLAISVLLLRSLSTQ